MTYEEPHKTSRKTGRPAKKWIVLACVFTLTAAVGISGWIAQQAGYGFLWHRLLLYGQGEIYVLNLGEDDRYISVDGREARRVVAGNARLLPLVGGESVIVETDSTGRIVRERSIETAGTHVLLNLDEGTCLVVAKLQGVIEEQEVSATVASLLKGETELYDLESTGVIWPRGYPRAVEPRQTDSVMSVEVVDCSLLDDRDFLEQYVVSRIEDRMR